MTTRGKDYEGRVKADVEVGKNWKELKAYE